jgi:hypothetical protein
MRFRLGRLPEYKDFIPNSSWKPFDDNESSIWMWQIKALPTAIINVAIILVIWITLTPAEIIIKNVSFPLPILGAIIILVSVLIVHELIHSIFHPKLGFSRKTIIGFWASKMLLYTSYGRELTRNRYIRILLAPLLLISIIPISISILTGFTNLWMIYSTVVNAFLSSGDILATWTILKIPSNTIIRNKGESAYWKETDTK